MNKSILGLWVVLWSWALQGQSNLQLVWQDEFSGLGQVDTAKWWHQVQLPTGSSWYNGEIQHYTNRDTNAFVANGRLHITALKENYTHQGHTKSYTSARLNSKMAFTYGRMEVRAKLPSGVGTWPAIWTLGQNITEPGGYWQTQGYGTTSWPYCGEIDVMEHWGTNQNYVQSALHMPSSFGNTQHVGGQTVSTASSAFHTYAMDWTPDSLVFSVDNVVHYIYAPANKDSLNWPFDKPQYILLNFAILPSISSQFVADTLVIDYVRVYERAAATPKQVTFQVDMNGYSGSYNKVYVSGAFNNWSGNGFELSDPNGDGVYSGTTALFPGNHEYKFTTDQWADQEWLDPVNDSACTLSSYGFTNRLLQLGQSDTVLPAACWESCAACQSSPALPQITFAVNMNAYVGSFAQVYVSGNFNNWDGTAHPLSDPDGDGIWTSVLALNPGLVEWKFTVDNWSDGENFTPGAPCTLTSYGFTNRAVTVNTGETVVLPSYCWETCVDCAPPAPAQSGGCITCDTLNVGDFFLVDGDSIEVVDRARLLAIVAQQGDLTKVCVSHVTDLKNLFRNAAWFNQDIGRWDVRQVTNMNRLFQNAANFNQNLSQWEVGSVVRMTSMFEGATAFDNDLSGWCVSHFLPQNSPPNFATGSGMSPQKLPQWGNCPNTYEGVTTLATGAFLNPRGCIDCTALQVGDFFALGGDTLLVVDRPMLDSLIDLHADLSKVCVSHLTDLKDALRGQTWFNTNLSRWDVSHVTTFNNTFRKALEFDQPIGNWDVSSATNMSRMFFRAQAFNQDLGNWDVSNVTRMNTLFKRAFVFDQDLSSWDVSQVQNMDHMFRAAYAFDQDLSAWCLPLIPAKPAGFSANTPLTNAQMPQWGGCGTGASKHLGNAPSSRASYLPVPLEAQENTAWTLFPNPTDGQFSLNGTFQGSYRLTDSRGTLIREGAATAIFDLSDQPPGLYFFTLFTPDKAHLFKVVRE